MTNNEYSDQRSKKFIFVPFCLMCQAFQARGIVRFGFSSTITPIIQELLTHDVNIIQMPCPESLFGGYEKGLRRNPKGLTEYDNIEFKETCEHLSSEILKMIKGILANDYKIVGILGIEYSPSCSINLQYSKLGTTHRPGLYIESLQRKLTQEKIDLPFLGINRRGIKRSQTKLRDLLKEKTKALPLVFPV